jgi:hypothetical protein
LNLYSLSGDKTALLFGIFCRCALSEVEMRFVSTSLNERFLIMLSARGASCDGRMVLQPQDIDFAYSAVRRNSRKICIVSKNAAAKAHKN